MPQHEALSCPRCGAQFECKVGSITLCHCSDILLSPSQQEYIAQTWQGCLCHACLLELKNTLPDKATADKISSLEH